MNWGSNHCDGIQSWDTIKRATLISAVVTLRSKYRWAEVRYSTLKTKKWSMIKASEYHNQLKTCSTPQCDRWEQHCFTCSFDDLPDGCRRRRHHGSLIQTQLPNIHNMEAVHVLLRRDGVAHSTLVDVLYIGRGGWSRRHGLMLEWDATVRADLAAPSLQLWHVYQEVAAAPTSRWPSSHGSSCQSAPAAPPGRLSSAARQCHWRYLESACVKLHTRTDTQDVWRWITFLSLHRDVQKPCTANVVLHAWSYVYNVLGRDCVHSLSCNAFNIQYPGCSLPGSCSERRYDLPGRPLQGPLPGGVSCCPERPAPPHRAGSLCESAERAPSQRSRRRPVWGGR